MLTHYMDPVRQTVREACEDMSKQTADWFGAAENIREDIRAYSVPELTQFKDDYDDVEEFIADAISYVGEWADDCEQEEIDIKRFSRQF